ncbi:MAG: PadR family transcriptional regulator [Planctomycetes bacterium]|nr:PadR family transcriptional regulator [Planctomycetota bacterium]
MDLPSTVEFQLLALVVTERSGRDVAHALKNETGRTISYGTLYTTFRRLRESGWVSVRDDVDEDGRVRWFRITAAGLKAMERAREQYRGLAEFGLGGQLA